MRTYSDNDPTGNSRATDFAKRTRAVTQREGQLYSGLGVKIQETTQGRRIKFRAPPPAPAGLVFQYPLELDPTVPVPANTVVYISSSSNPLAAGVYTDLVTNTIKSSNTGVWVAKKDVPAAVTVGGVLKYNVPQLPYPGATGGSYGSHPYTGDLDGANVFWVFLSQTPNCSS